MPKTSAADLQKAAAAIDLTGFNYELSLETSVGPICLTLDAVNAPGHVRNIVALAESGFMIQGGCPQGSGTGGPGYTIPAEFNRTPHEPGVLSMARTSDPNSAGSQFFICLEKVTHLDNQYTAFGRTADPASLAVVQAIGAVRTASGDKPLEPVVINKVTVTRKPQ